MSGMADEQSCFYDRGKGGWYHKATEYRPRPGELTKCKRLIADLVALQAEEPNPNPNPNPNPHAHPKPNLTLT